MIRIGPFNFHDLNSRLAAASRSLNGTRGAGNISGNSDRYRLFSNRLASFGCPPTYSNSRVRAFHSKLRRATGADVGRDAAPCSAAAGLYLWHNLDYLGLVISIWLSECAGPRCLSGSVVPWCKTHAAKTHGCKTQTPDTSSHLFADDRFA